MFYFRMRLSIKCETVIMTNMGLLLLSFLSSVQTPDRKKIERENIDKMQIEKKLNEEKKNVY